MGVQRSVEEVKLSALVSMWGQIICLVGERGPSPPGGAKTT